MSTNDSFATQVIRQTGVLVAVALHFCGLLWPLLAKPVAVAGETAIIGKSVLQLVGVLIKTGNWLLAFCVLVTVVIIPIFRHMALAFPVLRSVRAVAIVFAFDMTAILVVAILLVASQLPGIVIEDGVLFLSLSILTPFASDIAMRWFRSAENEPPSVAVPSKLVFWLTLISLALFALSLLLPFIYTAFGPWSQSKRLIDGIFMLYHSGSWKMALVLAVFSLMFPTLKLALLFAFNRNWINLPQSKLKFLITAGPWSLLDVFAVLVIVLYHLIGFAIVARPGAGMWLFLASIALSIIASHSIQFSHSSAFPSTPSPLAPDAESFQSVASTSIIKSKPMSRKAISLISVVALLALLSVAWFVFRDNPSIVGYDNLRLGVLIERISKRQRGALPARTEIENDIEFYSEVRALANKMELMSPDDLDRKDSQLVLQKCIADDSAMNRFGKATCIAVLSGRLRISDPSFLAQLEKIRNDHMKLPIHRDEVFEHHEFLRELNYAIDQCSLNQRLSKGMASGKTETP